MRPFNKKVRIGDLLLEYGMISEAQLQEALDYQKEEGIKLGEALIKLGFITKASINEMLEYQMGIPYINLSDYPLDKEIIHMIPEHMARKNILIAIRLMGDDLYVAMEDPLNIYAIEDLNIYTGKEIIPMLSTEESIMKAIDIHYGKDYASRAAAEFQEQIQEMAQLEDEEETEDIQNAPIVKLVNTIMEQAVRHNASDIHIEPYEEEVRIRFRIDGKLLKMFSYENNLLNAIVTRLKIMGNMNISEKRLPQDGRFSIKVNRKPYDVRVSILPTVYGEKTVMRISSKDDFKKTKEELGFSKNDLERFDDIISHPHGIILVTGPTGSGKSTTLYTVLSEINKEDINIITVEDPVESQIEGINQVQVNAKAGLTFATSLRSILRQDPDVIMIGEIRDYETAEIAVRASITGHLVVSTLHTNDSASTISRLVDMGLEPFLLGASLVGIIAQRLVRRLCPKCKKKIEASPNDKILLGKDLEEKVSIYEARGCYACNHTGYLGRKGIYEIMPISQEIRLAISKNATADEIKEIAIKEEMSSLRKNAAISVIEGITSIEELLRITYE